MKVQIFLKFYSKEIFVSNFNIFVKINILSIITNGYWENSIYEVKVMFKLHNLVSSQWMKKENKSIERILLGIVTNKTYYSFDFINNERVIEFRRKRAKLSSKYQYFIW